MGNWSAERSLNAGAGLERAVREALDAVLEAGVPRRVLADCSITLGVAGDWTAAFADAERAIEAQPRSAPLGDAPADRPTAGDASDDPPEARLLACARAIDALAHATGLDVARQPALARLRAVLAAVPAREAEPPARRTDDAPLTIAAGGGAPAAPPADRR